MWTLCVTYDLRAPGRNYDKLFDYLKSQPAWCHPVESVWFIATDKSPEFIRDEMQGSCDSNDKILVVRTAAPGAWVNLTTESSEWLKKNL